MTRKETLEKTIDFDDAINRIVRLEQENAEVKKEIRCECTRCVYSDSPCIRSDYGVENDEDVCPNYENVFTAYTKLKEENTELRKEWQEQVQKATDEGYARTLQTIQLSRAKEVLRNLLSAYITYADSFDDRDNEIVEEAVQFLNSEVEK